MMTLSAAVVTVVLSVATLSMPAGAAAEELFAGSWTGRELYEDTSFARNDGVYAPPNTRHACGEKLLSVNADPDNDEMYFWWRGGSNGQDCHFINIPILAPGVVTDSETVLVEWVVDWEGCHTQNIGTVDAPHTACNAGNGYDLRQLVSDGSNEVDAVHNTDAFMAVVSENRNDDDPNVYWLSAIGPNDDFPPTPGHVHKWSAGQWRSLTLTNGGPNPYWYAIPASVEQSVSGSFPTPVNGENVPPLHFSVLIDNSNPGARCVMSVSGGPASNWGRSWLCARQGTDDIFYHDATTTLQPSTGLTWSAGSYNFNGENTIRSVSVSVTKPPACNDAFTSQRQYIVSLGRWGVKTCTGPDCELIAIIAGQNLYATDAPVDFTLECEAP